MMFDKAIRNLHIALTLLRSIEKSILSEKSVLLQQAVHGIAGHHFTTTHSERVGHLARRVRACNGCVLQLCSCAACWKHLNHSTMLRQSEGPRRGKGKNLNLGAIDEMQAVATGAIAARPAMPARKSKLRARVSRPEVGATAYAALL
jgi:hypothetical protein